MHQRMLLLASIVASATAAASIGTSAAQDMQDGMCSGMMQGGMGQGMMREGIGDARRYGSHDVPDDALRQDAGWDDGL
jgi:hypothetical protein